MNKSNWKRRAWNGALIGIVMYWIIETFKQIGTMISELNRN
jgi:hypothetical protein